MDELRRARQDAATSAADPPCRRHGPAIRTSYGQYQLANGLRVPAWLITGNADPSSEAVLGLAAYVQAGGGAAARTALAELAEGTADMGSGTAGSWPYGAILPAAASRSEWHAWAAQMPTALADAATALHQPGLLRAAVADAAIFTPHLLTATGPDNLWGPAPVDGCVARRPAPTDGDGPGDPDHRRLPRVWAGSAISLVVPDIRPGSVVAVQVLLGNG